MRALAPEVRFSMLVPTRKLSWKTVPQGPQGLKPSPIAYFTARLKPCPSYSVFFLKGTAFRPYGKCFAMNSALAAEGNHLLQTHFFRSLFRPYVNALQ